MKKQLNLKEGWKEAGADADSDSDDDDDDDDDDDNDDDDDDDDDESMNTKASEINLSKQGINVMITNVTQE